LVVNADRAFHDASVDAALLRVDSGAGIAVATVAAISSEDSGDEGQGGEDCFELHLVLWISVGVWLLVVRVVWMGVEVVRVEVKVIELGS
jgi:hypothetical protein